MTTSTRLNSPRDLAATVAVQAAELAALRQELADTNRGVVALYAELDDKFRALYVKAHGGICLLDAQGRIVDANPALLRLLRRDLQAVLGRRVSDFVAPDWVDGLASPAAPGRPNSRSSTRPARACTSNGASRPSSRRA